MSDRIPLLRADPHKWGRGAIHQIDEDKDQTVCGKSPGACPGTKFYGTKEQITCKICLRSLEAKAKHALWKIEWERGQREAEELRVQRRIAYYNYLQTPEWKAKRAKVLARANGRCEGCGERRATQVHHMRYPQDCWPGTPEWIAREKLFDLRAICTECHEDVHP